METRRVSCRFRTVVAVTQWSGDSGRALESEVANDDSESCLVIVRRRAIKHWGGMHGINGLRCWVTIGLYVKVSGPGHKQRRLLGSTCQGWQYLGGRDRSRSQSWRTRGRRVQDRLLQVRVMPWFKLDPALRPKRLDCGGSASNTSNVSSVESEPTGPQ